MMGGKREEKSCSIICNGTNHVNIYKPYLIKESESKSKEINIVM